MINTIILIAVPLFVVVTMWLRYRTSRLQAYPLIVEEGLQQGIPALEEGNFVKAYHLLSEAKTAVNALGGAVEEAAVITKAADEAEVFNNLCTHTLEQILAEAGRTPPDTWPSRFDALYKGQYFVFDTRIRAEPVAGEKSGYELEYVVLPDGATSSFRRDRLAEPDQFARIDLTGFELFEQPRRQVGDQVIFGASSQASNGTRIRINNGSFGSSPRAASTSRIPRPSKRWDGPAIPETTPNLRASHEVSSYGHLADHAAGCRGRRNDTGADCAGASGGGRSGTSHRLDWPDGRS